jgi:hypothetical protein
MILALLEHTALRVGVTLRPERGMLWSCYHGARAAGGTSSTYSQVLGHKTFVIALTADGKCSGTLDTDGHGPKLLFQAEGTLRVVTDLAGTVTEIWGISNTTEAVQVALADPDPARGSPVRMLPPLGISLAPNAEWAVTPGGGKGRIPNATILRVTPFYPPF